MGQDLNLARKIAVYNAGCVFAYFCGGHKNNFPKWFRSSFKGNALISNWCSISNNIKAPVKL